MTIMSAALPTNEERKALDEVLDAKHFQMKQIGFSEDQNAPTV
jgi:hypothetical protein